MKRLQIYADDYVEYWGPTLQSDDSAVATITSCTARLYDDAINLRAGIREEALTADAVTPFTTIEINSARFLVGDTVEIELDDGTLHETTIATIPDAASITLTAGLDSVASKNAALRRLFHQTTATFIELLGGGGTKLKIGDNLELRTDAAAGTSAERTVVDRHEDWVEISSAAGIAISCGRRLARKLGANVSMTLFGTPTANLEDGSWGYRGIISDSHADLKEGQKVRIEIHLIDTPGNVVHDQTLRAVVMGDG